MKIGLLGSSFKTTPIEIREKLAFTESLIPEAIEHFKAKCHLDDLIILSTCNRVELYFTATNPLATVEALEQELLQYLKIPSHTPINLYRKIGRPALEHLFRVSSSLESMVIGEPQILGQVKNAYQVSSEKQDLNYLLNQAFHKAFVVAKRVRHETGIARFAVSISFAAVELAKRIFEELNDKVVMIVGAGEMAELAAVHLLKAGCSHIMVTNRTFSRAVTLAEKFQGSAVHFESLEKNLENADIIISSTGAKGFIITKKMIQKSLKKRKYNPMFLIDIAVPRDIDPEINDLNNAYTYDIDDLQTVVESNLKEREKEADKAKNIIHDELDNFEQWLSTLEVVPTIKALREQITELAQQELQKSLPQMGDLTKKQEQVMNSLVNSLANKILHQPTIFLRQKAKEEESPNLKYVGLVQDMFDLQLEEKPALPTNVIKIK